MTRFYRTTDTPPPSNRKRWGDRPPWHPPTGSQHWGYQAWQLLTFWILILSLGITLGGCQGAQPDRATVTQALNQHLQVTQHQLNALFPQPPRPFHLSQVHISQRLPLTIDGSPAYRVQGEYSLRYDRPLTPETSPETSPETPTLPSVWSSHNPFELYLQPQIEGKTWHLFTPQGTDPHQPPQWASYSLH
ncbi:hypothetical protein [Prochlorothrix hollandica]|uniref:hypothetical protein n=2 Tax=Prochlorothrix hollandica TaxID=1223 RepID=UPI000345BF37|nr:hypothetical protein [Prochlorothrix hollandica]